jgi:hypothetical protein
MSKIEKIVHPDAFAIAQAWVDEAVVTRQPYIEKPAWFRNTETGQLYYSLFGCVGWPTEVSEKDEGLPGYAAILGVIKPKDESKRLPKDALFQLLAEVENRDIPTLLSGMLQMRSDWGFSDYSNLLESWYGDPERYVTTIALLNERLTVDNKTRFSIVMTPPDDFYEPKSFDHYVRSMRSVLMPDKIRFYFGQNELLKNRLRAFRQNDPAVFAMGGLVHSLLSQTMWMDHMRENMFVVHEEGDVDYESN